MPVAVIQIMSALNVGQLVRVLEMAQASCATSARYKQRLNWRCNLHVKLLAFSTLRIHSLSYYFVI